MNSERACFVLVEHAERAVAGAGHGPGLLDDVAQDLGQLEVRLDEQRRLEHPAKLGGILDGAERHRGAAYPVASGARGKHSRPFR